MTKTETTETSLTVRRTFDAPIERVFEAFVDPNQIAAWYHPGEMTTEVDAWEAKERGELDITMVADEDRYRNVGTFREVVEHERIVHTWLWAGEDQAPESLVTVTFQETEDGTEVVLTHEKLPDAEWVEDHLEGWIGCLENLASAL